MFWYKVTYWGRIQRKTWCMGPYAGVDYNLKLFPLQSRFQHNNYGQRYMPEATLTLCQSRLYPPVRDFKFGLCISTFLRTPCSGGHILPKYLREIEQTY